MAQVNNFEQVVKERPQVHGVVRCGYFDFIASDGKRYLTLETYGSSERDMPDKISQSLQFDEGAAERLMQVIRRTFPNIR